MSADRPESQHGSSHSRPAAADSQPASGEALETAKLKLALKAFKKRLKMANLDHESRLGHGPTSSGGRGASIVAIVPPSNYPTAVWDELARLGKLRRAGQGMYEMGDPM